MSQTEFLKALIRIGMNGDSDQRRDAVMADYDRLTPAQRDEFNQVVVATIYPTLRDIAMGLSLDATWRRTSVLEKTDQDREDFHNIWVMASNAAHSIFRTLKIRFDLLAAAEKVKSDLVNAP